MNIRESRVQQIQYTSFGHAFSRPVLVHLGIQQQYQTFVMLTLPEIIKV